ncbi:MAG: hypothetical protein R2856_33005 [Caldilineaceae bacterium]
MRDQPDVSAIDAEIEGCSAGAGWAGAHIRRYGQLHHRRCRSRLRIAHPYRSDLTAILTALFARRRRLRLRPQRGDAECQRALHRFGLVAVGG